MASIDFEAPAGPEEPASSDLGENGPEWAGLLRPVDHCQGIVTA